MEHHLQRTKGRLLLARIVKPLLVALAVVVVIKAFVLEAYRIPSGSMETTLVPGDFVLVNKLAYGLRTPAELPLVGLSLPAVTLVPGKDVRRGDVVVFTFTKKIPGNQLPSGSKLVKRVVALPGDTVLIVGGDIRVNGQPMRLPQGGGQLSARSLKSAIDRWAGPVVVPYRGQAVDLTGEQLSDWIEIIRAEGHEVTLSPEGLILIDGRREETYTVREDYYYVLGDNLGNSFDSRYWGFVSDQELIGEVLMIYWSWRPAPGSETLSTVSSIRWERVGSLVR